MAKHIYKDLSFSFEQHPITGDLITSTDVYAIRYAVHNLLFTKFFEYGGDPDVGSGVHWYLFKNDTVFNRTELRTAIKDALLNYEPRIVLEGLNIKTDQNGTYDINLQFYMININKLEEISIKLERLR